MMFPLTLSHVTNPSFLAICILDVNNGRSHSEPEVLRILIHWSAECQRVQSYALHCCQKVIEGHSADTLPLIVSVHRNLYQSYVISAPHSIEEAMYC